MAEGGAEMGTGADHQSEVFQQLWKGIAQLQHESGISKQAWTAKDQENAALKTRAEDLAMGLEREKSQVVFLRQRVLDLEKALSEREEASSQLAARFTSELKSTKALIEAHSTGAQKAIAQCKSVEAQLLSSQRALEQEKRSREAQEEKTLKLEQVLGVVKEKFENAKMLLEKENEDLRKQNAKVSEEMKAMQASQTTDAGHILKLSDSAKALKADLRQAAHRERLLHERLKQQLMERDKVEALQQENIRTLEKEINRLCQEEKRWAKEGMGKDQRMVEMEQEIAAQKQSHASAIELLNLDISKRDQMVEALTNQVGMLEMDKKKEAERLTKMQDMIRTVQEKHLRDACSFENKIQSLEKEKEAARAQERKMSTQLQAMQASNQALLRQVDNLQAQVNVLESGDNEMREKEDQIARLTKELEEHRQQALSFKVRNFECNHDNAQVRLLVLYEAYEEISRLKLVLKR